jgi:hypothetical protein
MPATDDPGRDISFQDASGRPRTVRLDDLRLLGEAVNALRVGADALAGASAHFAGAAHGLRQQAGDGRIALQYDTAFRTAQWTLRTLQDCWEHLARGLDTVADAHTESGGPSITTPGGTWISLGGPEAIRTPCVRVLAPGTTWPGRSGT